MSVIIMISHNDYNCNNRLLYGCLCSPPTGGAGGWSIDAPYNIWYNLTIIYTICCMWLCPHIIGYVQYIVYDIIILYYGL